MIYDLTVSILGTSSWTGIDALISHTSFVRSAIGVQNAFRSATLVRIPYVFRQAHARTRSISLPAFCIRAARCWHTRIRKALCRKRRLRCALRERISYVTLQTNTVRCVADNSAFGVEAARISARIAAFLVYASQVVGAFAVTDALWSAIRRRTDEVW